MALFAFEPLRIGDYLVLTLLCVTAFFISLTALISFLIQGGPDPEREHYADHARTNHGARHV